MGNGAAKVTFNEVDYSFFIAALTSGITCVNIRARKGPINDPQKVGSTVKYREIYGLALDDTNADQVITRALDRGGVLWLNRIAHYSDPTDASTLDAVGATLTLKNADDEDTLTLDATSEGAWGNGVLVTVSENAADSSRFDVAIEYPAQPTMNESWTSLTMNDDDERYAVTFLNENSKLVTATDEESGDPFVGDIVDVNGTEFTAGDTFAIDTANYSNMASSLKEAINASALSSSLTASYSSNIVTLTAVTPGTAGNSLTLAVTSDGDNITVSGSTLTGGAAAVNATGTITYGSPSNGDTITVAGTTFTKAASASATEFSTIAELNTLISALAAVNSTSDGSVITVTAATAGTAGNAITLAKTGSALTLSGATLSGGAAAVAATGTITFDTTPTVIDNPADIGPVALAGGDDGAAVDDDDWIGGSAAATGFYAFDGIDDAMSLAAIEATSPTVTTAGLAYCDNRKDMVYLCECPATDNTPDKAIDYRMGTGGYSHTPFDTSYGALYFGRPLVRSAKTNDITDISNLGDVIGVFAFNDKKGEVWNAPAGMQRGRIPNTLGVNYNVGTSARSSELDDLANNQINPILSFPDTGTVIWDQNTLQITPSALQSLNVRRLLIYMRKALTKINRLYLFEPNDPATWRAVYRLINPWMADLLSRRAFYDYAIQCDQDARSINDAILNTPERIDRGEFRCRLFIKPTRVVKYFALEAVITKSSADFKELFDIANP